MELYQIIATINNTSETFTLAEIPENFKGMKISQKFSFQTPIGYTPIFSIETMKIVQADKAIIDAVFETYGIESDVTLLIKKLNTTGTAYENLLTVAIDFETYQIFDVYSEFSVKSVTCLDFYNKIKNTEQDVILPTEVIVTNQIYYKNSVSVSAYEGYNDGSDLTVYFRFIPNNDSKFYNRDSSLYINTAGHSDISIYGFGGGTSTARIIKVDISANIQIFTDQKPKDIKLALCKNDISTILYDFGSEDSLDYDPVLGWRILKKIDTIIDVTAQNYNESDSIFLAVLMENDDFHYPITTITVNRCVIYIDLNKVIDLYVGGSTFSLKGKSINSILNDFFDGQLTSSLSNDLYLFNSNTILKLGSSATIKPTEFLGDVLKYLGAVINFKLDGTVKIDSFATFFNSILHISKVVEITDFKDLSIGFSSDLNFVSISAGKDIEDYSVNSYSQNWNKKISFLQENKNGSESYEIEPSKLRQDFMGLLNFVAKKQNTKNISFIFNKNLTTRTSLISEIIYDQFTPRDILVNWSRFLSFIFQNYSRNTLTLSSNGGNDDNLSISGVAQFDDIVLSQNPRLLPIEYNFKCLIDAIDFSEQILKISYNEDGIYLFVIEAETTDKLNEQKIKALQIQF